MRAPVVPSCGESNQSGSAGSGRVRRGMERAMGFEPTTFCLGSKHSTAELRPLVIVAPAESTPAAPAPPYGSILLMPVILPQSGGNGNPLSRRYSQHKPTLGSEVQSASSKAAEYTSISALLVYSCVARASRFSWPRRHAYGNTNQAHRSSHRAPFHHHINTRRQPTPVHRIGIAAVQRGTTSPPAGGRTAAERCFRCGRPPQNPPRAGRPTPLLPPSRSTNPAVHSRNPVVTLPPDELICLA